MPFFASHRIYVNNDRNNDNMRVNIGKTISYCRLETCIICVYLWFMFDGKGHIVML
jgi:hypothetical protein